MPPGYPWSCVLGVPSGRFSRGSPRLSAWGADNSNNQSDQGGIPTKCELHLSSRYDFAVRLSPRHGHGKYGQESGSWRAKGMRSRKAVESWATENWSRHALFCLTGPGRDNVLQEALRVCPTVHCPVRNRRIGPIWAIPRIHVGDWAWTTPHPPPASATSPPKSPPPTPTV